MIIGNRHKGKSTCLLKCDKCGINWQGNYYVLKKQNIHLCPSCSCKKGWQEKFIKNPNLIPNELKPYILKRLDNKKLNEHLPKRKIIKIIIKCPKCGYTRQSNSYDVLERQHTLCNSCIQKKRWKNENFIKKMEIIRGSKEYKLMMSTVMKNSQAWKDTQYLRNEGCKKYWENIRGCKFEDIKDEWYKYRRTIYKLSEINYRKFKNKINPGNIERGRNKHHLDHKFSVLEGFKNKIPVEIISHQFNLQMLSAYDNLSKDCRCDITKEELFGGTGYLKELL